MSNDLELLARAYVDEAQEINDAATALLPAVSLEEAVGVQLDGTGQIIGIGRQGLPDILYRSLLRAYIRVNTSGGTIEDLLEIARLASSTTAASQAFTYTESYPGEFLIEFGITLGVGLGAIVAEAVYQGKPAGVHGQTSYWEQVPVFAFDGANGNTRFDGFGKLKTSIRNRGTKESG